MGIIDDGSIAYWVGFNLVNGNGAAWTRILLVYFGYLESVWKAEKPQLRDASLGERVVDNLLQLRGQVDLERIGGDIERKAIKGVTVQDGTYPRRLKEIDLPPPVLFNRGEILLDDDWAVAIVGTPRMTAYGKQVAEELADFLARHEVIILSGLARGVDPVSHLVAIKADGGTLAILGFGVDTINPPEHRKLSEDISQHGALISERPVGTASEQ